MTSPDAELVLRTARLARLEISRAEAEALGPQFARILEALQVISKLDLQGVEPMLGATELSDVVREDRARPSLTQGEALAGAPKCEDGFYRVPRAVGGEG